jgi:hypothetical protein
VGAIIAVVTAIAEIIKIVAKVTSGIIMMFSGALQTVTKLFEALFLFFMGENEAALASFKESWNGIKLFFKGLFSALYGIVKPFVDPIISMINKVIDGVNKLRSAAGKDDIGKISLDGARATGGSVMRNRSYLVGENGPEVFTPSLGGRINREAVGGSVTNNVYITNPTFNDKQTADYFIDEIKRSLGRDQELTSIGAL